MRAIDLYAGIGGWSLGLRLAGVEVVHSYEWWQPAIDTHNGNHDTQLERTDIRTMSLDDLPGDIDMVVGSPPCTQFSYSNRGGSGDLADGQVDLVRFFAIVDRLKPKFWAMENVPRVAKYLEDSFSDPSSDLYKYRHLKPNIGIFDFSEFGCAQARRRCIATNLSLNSINAFKGGCADITLGDVIKKLAHPSKVVDPVWGVRLRAEQVSEREKEEALNDEELRLNRDSKIYHPIYNNMSFPDRLGSPARTVTATCTRVSRESIVVEDDQSGGYRRLTVRERGSLQGFPITYQFFGKSFAEKAKMIGNAIPPTFSYILASLAMGSTVEDFVPHRKMGNKLALPKKEAPRTTVDKAGKTYPSKRRFRAAIPGLRFKSGMRFEFANDVSGGDVTWSMRFYSGNSKDIRTHLLDQEVGKSLRQLPVLEDISISTLLDAKMLANLSTSTDGNDLQDIWTRRKKGKSPYVWVDHIGEVADQIHMELKDRVAESEAEHMVLQLIGVAGSNGKYQNEAKLKRYSLRILAGIIVGIWFNQLLTQRELAEAA